MSSIKSKLNIPMKRDIKTVQIGSDCNRVNSAAYETKREEDGLIFKAKSLTLTKPELIPLPLEEAYIFEYQIAQADKQHVENYSNTHGLYWYWCNKNNKKKKVVMVISCFKRDHGAADQKG